MTATAAGWFPPEVETAAAATAIAMAEFDAAVLATVAALAAGEGEIPPGGGGDTPPLPATGDGAWILLTGAAIVGMAALAGAGFLLWRRNRGRGDLP